MGRFTHVIKRLAQSSLEEGFCVIWSAMSLLVCHKLLSFRNEHGAEQSRIYVTDKTA